MSEIPPPLSNIRRVKRIAPLQLGKVMALTYGLMGLAFYPFILLMIFLAPHAPSQQRMGFLALGTGFMLFIPVIYAVMGFIGGVIGALIYNLIAKWVGGIEVEVEVE
jgi:glycopeptide antibiotics resistance protein